MFRHVAALHQSALRTIHLTTSVTVERPQPDGSWTVIGPVDASVQHQREFPSVSDPDQASTLEHDTLRVYVPADADVRRGDRIAWDGDHWIVGAASRQRSVQNYRRFDLTLQSETAVAPITITVNRREDGAWTEVGTFTVRRILDTRDPLPQGRVSVYEAFTAAGSLYTGVLIGDATFAAVRVGDWFTSGEMPGRIINVDRSDPDRIEASFQQEARGV